MTPLKAPWSDDVVLKLSELQSGARYGHPYTCINRSDGNHHNNGHDLGCLVPTTDGWICPDCDYTQDWAHESSTTIPLATEMKSLVEKLMLPKD
jgi:hypothetical protein